MKFKIEFGYYSGEFFTLLNIRILQFVGKAIYLFSLQIGKFILTIGYDQN